MSTHGSQPPQAWFEDLLDGRLSPEEHARMLERVEADPDLRAQYECQRAMDASLKRAFSPTIAPAAPLARTATSHNPVAAQVRRTKPRRLLRTAAMAAIIALCLGYSGWTLVDYLVDTYTPRVAAGPAFRAPLMPGVFLAAYHAAAEGDFEPDWVCETDAQFAGTFRRRLGQPLGFRADPPRIKMIGLSHGQAISPNTIVFLGTVGGEHALVFIDRAAGGHMCMMPPSSGLHLFRRQVGDLVLYELTPLDHPALLERFYQPGS